MDRGWRFCRAATRHPETQTATPSEAPRPQICILRMDGGEAQVLTHLKNGVSVVPVVARWQALGRGQPQRAQRQRGDRLTARATSATTPTSPTSSTTPAGSTTSEATCGWSIPATGKDKQITSGDDWNDTDPQWSPDSTRIAFVSDRTGKEYDDGHNKDVWVIAADGGALDQDFGPRI